MSDMGVPHPDRHIIRKAVPATETRRHRAGGERRTTMANGNTTQPKEIALDPELEREIESFEAEVARFQSGELSPERFRAFRLAHGIYGQRQPGVQMIRVKVPAGILTGAQMRRLADMAEAFTPTRLLHLTTRQDVQVH